MEELRTKVKGGPEAGRWDQDTSEGLQNTDEAHGAATRGHTLYLTPHPKPHPRHSSLPVTPLRAAEPFPVETQQSAAVTRRQQTGHSGPGHALEQDLPKSTGDRGLYYLLREKGTEGFLEEEGGLEGKGLL